MTQLSPTQIKQMSVDADFAVPVQDSVDNENWGDVIGNKTDTVDGDSLYSLALLSAGRILSVSRVYPTLANGVDVVSANANWTLGAFSTIVPVNTIADDYHIHFIVIEALDQNAVFELVLYNGATDVDICHIRFSAVGGFFGNVYYQVISPRLLANTRLRAKFASSNGAPAQATVRISLLYTIEV